ncbi:MAG TPA: hypothetical protein VJV78_15030, partial [Polyangiales bacterium]|nr:hypothetical protein [Polyangiales bacterium]
AARSAGLAPSSLQDPDAIAAAMVELQRERGVEIFVFRDDYLFASTKRKNLARVDALAGALERRGIRRFATVIRAGAADVERELFRSLRDRLKAIRVDLDVDGAALRRWSRQRRKLRAIEILRELDLYGCLNIVAFAQDATFASSLDFAREASDFPFEFARGDSLYEPRVARVSQLAAAAFQPRDRLVRRIMALRFELEVFRHFSPARHERSWRAEAIGLTRALGEDSVRSLRSIAEHVDRASDGARQIGVLSRGMRAAEAEVEQAMAELAVAISEASRRAHAAPTFALDHVAAPA